MPAEQTRPVTMDPVKKQKRLIFFTRMKCLGVLLLLALLEIGPVPIAPFLGMYLVIWRPPWFLELVNRLYGLCSASD